MNNHPTFFADIDVPGKAVYSLTEDVFSAFLTIKRGTLVKFCGTHWYGKIHEGEYGGLYHEQSIYVVPDPVNPNIHPEKYGKHNVIHDVSMKKLRFQGVPA